jgi:Pilus assembly protein, PilO
MASRLTPRTALVVGAVALLVVVLAGWFVLASPKRSEAARLGRDIDDARTQIRLSQAIIRSEAKNARGVDSERLAKAMPPDARESAILRELDAVARATRVRVNSIAPGAPTATGAYQTIPIPVVVEGSYFAIESFFDALRARADVAATSPPKVTGQGRLYSIPQIAFNGASDDGFIQVTSTIDAYTFAGASPTGTPPPAGTPEPSPASAASTPAASSCARAA